MSKLTTTEARLNIFMRILGVTLLALGIVSAYLTYTTPLAFQISYVFTLISALFIISGSMITISKLD